jgi:hypothetical protein
MPSGTPCELTTLVLIAILCGSMTASRGQFVFRILLLIILGSCIISAMGIDHLTDDRAAVCHVQTVSDDLDYDDPFPPVLAVAPAQVLPLITLNAFTEARIFARLLSTTIFQPPKHA